jgi:hypothetical protein
VTLWFDINLWWRYWTQVNFPAVAASCVDFQLRPLRSAGITRHRHYYRPFRHPTRPDLTVAAVQLRIMRTHHWASHVVVDFHVHACRRHYPGGTELVHLSILSHLTASFPEKLPGQFPQVGLSRPAQRSLAFRPACSLDRPRRSVTSKASTDWKPPPPLQLRLAGATRCQVGIAPTESRRHFTAHSFLAQRDDPRVFGTRASSCAKL